MIESPEMKETLHKELDLLAHDYMMYKLREQTTSQLRNLYQEKLYLNEKQICACIKSVMNERGCLL